VFDELYGVVADIGAFPDAGVTDPEVGRRTFEAVLHRRPNAKSSHGCSNGSIYLQGAVAESKHDRVLRGVEVLFSKRTEGGYLVGLVTGKVKAAAHIKLHRAQLNRFFSFGGYGSNSADTGEVTRIALRRATLVYGEAVAPEQAIVVGDTRNDIEGAHPAGIPCVAVASHYFNVEQLREAGADYASSLEEALPL
jgi:phosphoglycolate phosphatase-like HAD superfamily hydrolase